MILSPESAVAIARCWLGRWNADSPFRRAVPLEPHQPCVWCEEPLSYLMQLLEAFNAESRYDEMRDRYGRSEIEAFRRLSREVQRQRVDEAAHPVLPA